MVMQESHRRIPQYGFNSKRNQDEMEIAAEEFVHVYRGAFDPMAARHKQMRTDTYLVHFLHGDKILFTSKTFISRQGWRQRAKNWLETLQRLNIADPSSLYHRPDLTINLFNVTRERLACHTSAEFLIRSEE